ncbi:MAG: hypothetical protein HZC55_08015 [Verrucomicrobia bacterium]|jgi:hypothetical protein|nr:hypothetical protein [Verrucomicrobiota bacterium]
MNKKPSPKAATPAPKAKAKDLAPKVTDAIKGGLMTSSKEEARKRP